MSKGIVSYVVVKKYHTESCHQSNKEAEADVGYRCAKIPVMNERDGLKAKGGKRGQPSAETCREQQSHLVGQS